MKTNGINEVYKRLDSNTYRVFLNLPNWIDLKIYSVKVINFEVKKELLAEGLSLDDRPKLNFLINEVTTFQKEEWEPCENYQEILDCLECSELECGNCNQLSSFYHLYKFNDLTK